MRKIYVLSAVFFAFFAFTQADAAINWQGEYTQYTYSVLSNGGTFMVDDPFDIWGANETGSSTGSITDPNPNYSAVVSKSLTEHGGTIQMNAGAQGTGTDVSPENGLLVKGYAEIVLNAFDNLHNGVDGKQKVFVFVTRRFILDSAETCSFVAYLDGPVDFNVFGNDSYYGSSYSLNGNVLLTKFTELAGGGLSSEVFGEFNFNDTDTNDRDNILLTQTASNEYYELKVALEIETDLQNMAYPPQITTGADPFEGPFVLGNAAVPLELGASIAPANDELAVDFSGIGLYHYDNGDWTFLTGTPVENMIGVGSDLYVDFGSAGLYKYDGAWTFLTGNNPGMMTGVGDDLYVVISDTWLYKYNGDWTFLTGTPVENMIEVGYNLYVDFGSSGLYKYDGAAWTLLTGNNPGHMCAVNIND